MSTPTPVVAAAPASGRLRRIIFLVVVAGVSLGAGILAPRYFGASSKHAAEMPKLPPKQAFVPFGEVVVNLSEERLTRYLRVKLILVIDGNHEKEHTEKITKAKATLKSWLISHLTDKSLKEVSGGAGVNRVRREVLEQFNVLLNHEPDLILDVLFEEFVIQ
jgi:flagellar protein FliL